MEVMKFERKEMGCDGRLREEIGTAQEEMGCDERG